MKKITAFIVVPLLFLSLFVVTLSLKAAPVYAEECTAEAPRTAPKIFQVDRNGATATVYIEPGDRPYNNFFIAYGLSEGDQQFGVTFNQEFSTGAITYIINGLDQDTTYYFQTRAGNDCATGPWSNWFMSQGKGGSVLGASDVNITKGGLPEAGNYVPTILLLSLPLLFIILGFLL